MDVGIRLTSGERQAELESLQEWLRESAELQGRVTLVELPPPSGALGPVLDSILVALAPGTVATALATAVVTWIRHRSGGVRVEMELPDGRRVRLEADKVRTLTEAQLRAELNVVLAALQASASGGVSDGTGEALEAPRELPSGAGPVIAAATDGAKESHPRTR